MSDRELLELAAKAYWGDEIDDVCSIRWLEQDQAIGYTHGDNQDHNGQDREFVWNPIANDGDALRLESSLSLDVRWQEQHVIVGKIYGYAWQEPFYLHDGDKLAARRYAAVRAAAEIGKTMQ